MAIALSRLVRKIAVAGESGRRINRTIPVPLVTAPRMRNNSCQLVTVDESIVPTAYATTPPIILATQFPRYHPACLDHVSIKRH